MSQAIHQALAIRLVEDSAEGLPIGKIPNEKPVWSEYEDRTVVVKVLTSCQLFQRAYQSPTSCLHLAIFASLDLSERPR